MREGCDWTTKQGESCGRWAIALIESPNPVVGGVSCQKHFKHYIIWALTQSDVPITVSFIK